jgi:hypothetical protein
MSGGKYSNTGTLVGQPASSNKAAEAANPPLSAVDALQLLLDLAGMIPGAGAVPDLINAAISFMRGDFIGGFLSLFSAVPAVGDAAGLAKIVKNSEKYAQAIKVVEQQVLPKLPNRISKPLKEFIEKAKAKIDEVSGSGKQQAPQTKPEQSNTGNGGGKDNGQVKPRPKPKCGQGGPYKDRHDHDNAGMNWDHVPSKAALLEAAKRIKGSPLSSKEVTAIIENAPTIAVPEQLHRDHSETYGGRQNQTVDGEKRIQRDSQNLSKAAKENTDKLLGEIDKYDKGCKGAYKSAAEKIVKMTDDDWKKWLKKTMRDTTQ